MTTTNTVTFHRGDVRDVMAAMPASSVDLLVTSPPFLALRSYLPADHPDKHREIGSEATPAAFLDTMLELSAVWRRLVTPTGSIAVEIGDTYSGSGGATDNRESSNGGNDFAPRPSRSGRLANYSDGRGNPDGMRDTTFSGGNTRTGGGVGWPLAKSLCGIPTLYTWSLAYGRNLLTGADSPAGRWRIRNLLTWTRPNPPVGALGDKYRPATSFVTVACASDRRWFDLDAVRGDYTDRSLKVKLGAVDSRDAARAEVGLSSAAGNRDNNPAGAPPLDWWDHPDWQPLHRLPTAPYTGSHYAAYPIALPRRLIESMAPREVCTVCGETRRRIVDVTFTPHGERHDETKGARGVIQLGEHAQHMTHGRATKNVDTLGWSDCGHDLYRPGRVFDPFAGSGTTAVAAALCGRDAVLIDLDARNVDLCRRRLAETMLIVNETVSGDVTTWTVRHDMPGTKGEAAGQASLFAEEAS